MNPHIATGIVIYWHRLPEMTVYDLNRAAPCKAPTEFTDDVSDQHFVPAPCQVACPIGTDAPSYIAYTWEGKFEEAFEAISATNPFSSICGRVCDAPCEPACRRADSDGAIGIRNIKRYILDKLGPDYKPDAVPVTRPETVGIVGAGPAGLTAAKDLAEAGFEVHVYEMSDRLGGMMVWGIPRFRLPENIIDEDLDRLKLRCPGIKIHLSTALGRDVSLQDLKARHDAVLLSIGAWAGKSMPALDVKDERVVNGVDFLRQVNAGERPEMPETVLVIGGGDVAMDACRAAIRLPGCKNVKVIYRRGPNEIPARREELEGAIKEGIEIVCNTQPVAIEFNDDGFVLDCVQTELGEPDDDGRRHHREYLGKRQGAEDGVERKDHVHHHDPEDGPRHRTTIAVVLPYVIHRQHVHDLFERGVHDECTADEHNGGVHIKGADKILGVERQKRLLEVTDGFDYREEQQDAQPDRQHDAHPPHHRLLVFFNPLRLYGDVEQVVKAQHRL